MDPYSPRITLQFQHIETSSFHESGVLNSVGLDLDDEPLRTEIVRLTVPIPPWGPFRNPQIARISVPWITNAPTVELGPGGPGGFGVPRIGDVSGLSDTNFLHLVSLPNKFGKLGVGSSFIFPTATAEQTGTGKFSGGPAFLALKETGPWQFGFLVRQFWSFAGNEDREDVNQLLFQPLFSYRFWKTWSIGTGDMSISYDWNQDEFTYVPMTVSLEKLTRIGSQSIRVGAQAEYNFIDNPNAPEWTFRLGVDFFFPAGKKK